MRQLSNSEIILNSITRENDLRNSFLHRFPPENLALTRKQSSFYNQNKTNMTINNESSISDSLLLNIDIQEYPF